MKLPRLIIVAGNEQNMESAFWSLYIGTTGHFLRQEPDETWTVILHDGNPVEGVKPERFRVVTWQQPAPWWKRLLAWVGITPAKGT